MRILNNETLVWNSNVRHSSIQKVAGDGGRRHSHVWHQRVPDHQHRIVVVCIVVVVDAVIVGWHIYSNIVILVDNILIVIVVVRVICRTFHS